MDRMFGFLVSDCGYQNHDRFPAVVHLMRRVIEFPFVLLQKTAAIIIVLCLLSGASGAKQLCELRCSQATPQTLHHSFRPPSHSTHHDHHSMERSAAAVVHHAETASNLLNGPVCREYAVAAVLAEKSRLSVVTALAIVALSGEAQPLVEPERCLATDKSPPGPSLLRIPEVALRI
jgi:hypothetical protein